MVRKLTERFQQICFQIEKNDNVCTALAELNPGKVKINGAASLTEMEIAAPVRTGHKLANRLILEDEPIVKYGVVIGKATRLIEKGEWVHLHNCKSLYDERSATLDVNTGVPTDTKYE